MFKGNKKTVMGASLISVAVVMSGCGGEVSVSPDEGSVNTVAPITQTAVDVSDASIVASAVKVSGGNITRSGGDFSFPEISNDSGSVSMTIPAGPLPTFAARRTVSTGGGQTIGYGDSVILKYDMFAWSNGELVDSSSLFDEAHTVKAGVSDEYPIPEYLASSLLGRSLGDTVQVVLPVGTEDLPPYLDNSDAYVLLVELM